MSGEKNKFWLDDVAWGYKTQALQPFLLDSAASVNKLVVYANNVTLSGVVNFTNIGDYIMRLYVLPINKDKVGKLSTINNTINIRSFEEWKDVPNYEITLRDYFYMGEYYYKVDSYLDTTGYTDIEVYLPYAGYYSINPNDVANKYIQFRLTIDYTTGSGMYYIAVSSESISNTREDAEKIERIISTISCDFSIQIPFSSNDSNERARTIALKAIQNIASYASKGKIQPADFTEEFSRSTIVKERRPETKRLVKTYQEDTQETYSRTYAQPEKTSYISGVASQAIQMSANALASLTLQTTTEQTSNSALTINASPQIHILIKKPKVVYQVGLFNHLYGKPYGEVERLSNMHGYTKIAHIHLQHAKFGTATQEEMAMLKEALLQGVYLP